MKGTFLFLGTGGSTGIPVIGCPCAVCSSDLPRNKRLRPSGLIQIANQKLLIDIGPDFREQALRYKINHLDGLLLTHTHYDHIAGIDELRIFYVRQKKPFLCLLSKESLETLMRRYDYFFQPLGKTTSLSARLEFQVLEKELGQVEFLGLQVGYCSFFQGGMKVTGFRIGDFAYISDIRDYDDSVFSLLDGINTLVLSALRSEPSPLHLSFEEAVLFAKRTGAKQTWLTHLGHFHDHDTANALLPPEVQLGYDGLELEFQYEWN
ncbi:MAG: MBL fold metallo-hydrolase [Chlamydiota bacterium]